MTTTQTRRNPRLTDGVDQDLRFLIPEGICRTFRVMPYASVDGTVLVAAADADDAITAHVVAERIDRPVQLVRHTVNEIVAAIDSVYPPQETEVESPEARRARMQMAQMLTRSGLITDDQLQRAMLEYSRTGDPLGDILVSHEAISEDVLVAALSEMYQMQRVGLAEFTPDLEVARRLPEPLAQAFQVVPVAATDDLVLLAVARPLDTEQAAEIEEALGSPFRQLLANRSELDQLIQRVHARHYAEVATRLLMETRPEDSAHVVITGGQKAGLVMMMIVIVVCGVIWPLETTIGIIAACSLLYLVVSFYKFRLTLRALGTHLETDVTDEEIASIDERHLPMYTILVPLYKEAGIVPRLVRDLNALDYPRTRLDVKLLCEEDDVETVEKIRSMQLPPHFHLVVVPDSLPKTKPKACNYGLQLANGDFCVIFDAEDRPDPDQLKKAIIAFSRVDNNVVCVQAKLNHFNQDQNLLTAWFANEYSMHFDLILPAMGAAESPIPLGGTSNHFLTAKLRELGAWDPFNVTEDADLGIRLHREGYRTAMIDSTTLEEANSQVPNWIRQRSRWIKGYIQTWLVHMRHPFALLSQTGVRGFLSFNLTMGSAFVLLLNPIFWALTTIYVFSQAGLIEQLFPGVVFYAASLLLFAGNFVFIYLSLAGSLQRGSFTLTRTALLAPLYWGLMSWAAWKGFIQLFTNPFYWEKTTHGLDDGVELVTTATVVHTKDRLSGVVQAVGRRPRDVPRRWWESFLVWLLFTIAYTWFGYWVVVETHVVGFETLDRLNRALMVWHNDPAKLSAIGFDYPPLATLLIAPLAIFRGFVTSMAVVPLASAMFAGITMVAFNTMMRRAMVSGPLRYAVLIAVGANPMVLLYATTGTRHFVWIAFLITGLGSLFAWYITADVRFVMLAGIAYALSALAGYSSLTFFVLSAIMVGAILARLGADGTEVEGTVVGFGAPTVYVIALWTVFNLILLGRPFAWITRSSDAAASGGLEQFSGVELLRATGELVLYGAPIAIIVLPALIFAGFARSNPFALWLGVLLGAAILMPALAVAFRLTDSPMLMRNALPILLIAVVGAIWLARSADEGSTLVAALLVVGLVVSIPWTLNEMKSYRYQNLEAPFAAAITTGESQEGAETRNGEKVGIVSEQAMAEYIKNNVTRDNSILTDNAQNYGVMMLTGHPEYFVDRVDESDGPWKVAARNPAEYVDYMLMSAADNGDLLTKLYPDAASGSDPLLQVVYRTPRYVLVGVPADYQPGTETTTAETADLSVDTESSS